jgi:hypothetical protein
VKVPRIVNVPKRIGLFSQTQTFQNEIFMTLILICQIPKARMGNQLIANVAKIISKIK